MTTEVAEVRFPAMGSEAHVLVVGPDAGDAVEWARRRIDDLERRWSRFIEGTEVERLNRAAGEAVEVSAETCRLARVAVDARRMTGGLVDVTVLGAVIRAGYDKAFGRQTLGRDAELETADEEIQVGDGWVRLPAGSGLDPGGIGKGLAADIVVEELLAGGASGALVSMGGDLRVEGAPPPPPHPRSWTVAVEHPDLDEPVAMLGIERGAVATSTTRLRAWVEDGRPRHHLIDPRTGEPSTSDLTLAAVVAGEGWVAEVLAKAVLLGGSPVTFEVLTGFGDAGLAVTADGEVVRSAGLAAFL